MGFSKIDSDLWTIFLFHTQKIAFEMLCMIFSSLIMKYRFSKAMTSFIENDLTYQ